jgi:hypothetical protein
LETAQVKSLFSISTLESSLRSFCTTEGTQSGEHIKPIHSYCATRLVLEGGFPPSHIFPATPFKATKINNFVHELDAADSASKPSEHRVLGGIKYKAVDVTAVIPGIGPALGISAKSTGNAFRNLTNRMEEALGECTNVHLMYPGFVFGFLHLIRFRKESEVKSANDVSFDNANDPLPGIRRYHEVLAALAGRSAITDPGMRYESVGMLVYRCTDGRAEIWKGYPRKDSPVHFSKFFERLYNLYDLRYAYPDPDSSNIRKTWKLQTAAIPKEFDEKIGFPWEVRLAAGDGS